LRIWGAETPEPIATKFCTPGAVQNVIMSANFGKDRLRGFGVARGRILAFSIDLLRRVENTRTTVRVCDSLISCVACAPCQRLRFWNSRNTVWGARA